MTPSRLLLVFLISILMPDVASARTFRVNQVPNGSRFGCALCHNNPAGGGLRNGFGSQVENTMVGDIASTAQVDWAAIFDMDGDSDGYSNGRELGDPDGTWAIGMGNPAGDTYAPYDRTESPCGDGVLENPPEECDTDALPADVNCEMFGWGPGTLSCSSTCRINQEACQGYMVVVPNNSNPPPDNNSNPPPTNNSTGTTNNETTSEPPPADADEGGCSTAGASPGGLLLLAVVLGFRRRRRYSPN